MIELLDLRIVNMENNLSEQEIGFKELYDEVSKDELNLEMSSSESTEVLPGNKGSEEEVNDIIMQSIIINNTVVMMKQHEEAMKELLDE